MAGDGEQAAAGSAELEAARLLLARMGVSAQDLVGTPAPRPVAPLWTLRVPIKYPCWSCGISVLMEDSAESIVSANVEASDLALIIDRRG
ncbi:hypothetical protein [Saccharopolyspora gloriosae]|uniref:hypothetical protein n=1 Tax=Saccharopolyspora gloriosae TaxID=455344 RepID=UPI001FB67237|nr:hypothetical protein [Saccharopolyspora gloriosae]